MKAPGILYRVSFLVMLQSLFIFAAVTYVSIENNESKIDRLVAYRFNFVSEYFRAQLEDIRQAHPAMAVSSAVDDSVLTDLLKKTLPFMKGLAGLTLLTSPNENGQYMRQAEVFTEAMRAIDRPDRDRITGQVDRSTILAKGIQVGTRFATAGGELKTVYIPWEAHNPNAVLAIIFEPGPIIGGDAHYNYIIIVLFLGITLVTLLTVYLIVRNHIRPLNHLIFGMEKTTDGEVLYKIEDVRNDEVGRVAAAFNSMSDSLWNQRQQLIASNRDLIRVNQKLTDTLTELSDANTSLAESGAFLSKLIENAPDAIIVTDPQGHILIFSRAAVETFAIGAEKAHGQDILTLFPYAPEKVFPADETTPRLIREEMICRKGNGESFPAFVCRAPIKEDSETVRAYLFILRDISESKRFQEMMISIDRMVTRGIMAGEVAHEINNYLAVILGNVELLPLFLARGDMAKVEKKLEVLKNSVGRIQRFSEGLVGYGNEEAVFQQEDLNQHIENLVTFLKPQNRFDGITFDLALDQHLPLVYFDSSQIQQMLTNLLNNAADALREKSGDRVIRIITARVDEEKAVRVSIVDNAGGLPADLPAVIFTTRYMGRRRGRGFGLMVVKQILDRHRGRIDYETSPENGTAFHVILPVLHPAEETETAGLAAGQVPA